jgi:hypothetical protein
MGQTDCFLHQLSHCDILSLLVCICGCSSHPSFCHRFGKTSPADRIHGEKLLLAFFYLFWAGCIITVYCYWYVLSSWSQSPPPVTYVCILLRQEMSLGLCFSIFTILVHRLCHWVMHSQPYHLSKCAPMVISISASAPPTTLRSNG